MVTRSSTRTILDRKLRRDLRTHLGSWIAIAGVVACGQAGFIAERTMARILAEAQREYYEEARFPDLFAQVRRAPEAIEASLRTIPGVARLETRVTRDVVVRIPGLREPATAHLVGLRPPGPGTLNHVLIRAGRRPGPTDRGGVLVSEGFADANGLSIGDSLGAILNERWQTLTVLGIGITAEFVYEVRPGDVLPDPRRYGVLWMHADLLAEATGFRGAWNEVSLTLDRDAHPPAVIAALDQALERYGTPGSFARERHPSHEFLSSEIRENRTFAIFIPAIFLGVAAFLIHMVLGRLVAQQREQVGMLKAFGIPDRVLLRHHLLFAAVPVGTGTLAGCLLGLGFARHLADIYIEFFRFPSLHVGIDPREFVAAAVIAALAAGVGSQGALRRLLAMPPAEAMRPEPPAAFAHSRMERTLTARVRGGAPRMVLRSLTHRPGRTALGALGIGLSSSVVIVGTFGFDAIARMREILFGRGSLADVTVLFRDAQGPGVLPALAHQPGVTRVEGIRTAPVRVRHEHRERLTVLHGVDASAQLRRTIDLQGDVVRIPEGGVALGVALAEVLQAQVGDTVELEFIEGRQPSVSLPVTSRVEDLSGLMAYVPAQDFPVLLGTGPLVTGADLRVDPQRLDPLYQALVYLPGIRAVLIRSATEGAFDATLRRSFSTVLSTLVLFASALAAGTIYSVGQVALSERARDLASLRVLGFTRGEVWRILFSELAALSVLGLPIGVLLGIGLAAAVVASFGTGELFRMPFVIGLRTLGLGILIPVVSGVAAAIPLRRRLDRLDLIRSLKTRE